MYQWLSDETARIKTGKFFKFERKAGTQALDEIERRFGQLPSSYKDFVQSFGHAALFRDEEHGWHALQVLEVPIIATKESGEPLLEIGTYSSAGGTAVRAYFKPVPQGGSLWPEVFEGDSWQLRRVAASFEAWLVDRYNRVRKRYGKREWQRILEGPPPFDGRERAIVEAIPLFRWRKLGVTPEAKVEFEIRNGSSTILPAITVGWRMPGGMRAWAALRVSDLAPGTSGKDVKDFSCYGSSVKPEQMEFYQLPLPGPEDRCLYWEFGDTDLRRLTQPKSVREQRRTSASAKYRNYGPGKEFWGVALDDLAKHPIWLWAEQLGLDDDEMELGGTEAWMRPPLREKDVTSDMHLPLILLKVAEANLYASALYNHVKRRLESITAFDNGCATQLTDVSNLAPPLTLSAVPTIEGRTAVQFVCEDLESAQARRVD